jgi:hypothetical protein
MCPTKPVILRHPDSESSSRRWMRRAFGLKQNGNVAGNRKGRWPVVLVGAVLLLAGTVALTARYWYTPTTSALVVNDESTVYSLDNCEDYLVTLAPGQSEHVQPFSDEHHACTVYRGRSNLGSPVGCLVFPSVQGAVLGGSHVKLSSMVPFSARWCSG